MKFKHSKEAEKRISEIKPELDTLNAEISKAEPEARNEDITIERREEIITAIKDNVEKRDALQREYDEAVKERDELKAAETKQFGFLENLTKPRISERRETQGTDVYETRAYELAWAKYVKTGSDSEVRALISTPNSGNDSILVPKTMANKIEDTLRTGGRLISLCDTINVKGITEYPVALERTDPELHNETGADPKDKTAVPKKKEKEITLTSVSMDPQFIAEILRTTRKFEADSISAFWDWLMSELPDALRRVIDRKILSGGQGKTDGIHGILTNTDEMFVAVLENHELNFNTANAAISLLDEGVDDNITLTMHRKTFFNKLMGMMGADGHPIWKQMTSNTERPAYALSGYPVVFTNELPAYDDAAEGEAYMVVGNFKAMKLNFPEGMNTQITRDAITEMEQNVIRYLSEIYVAGNITKPGSFVKVTKKGV